MEIERKYKIVELLIRVIAATWIIKVKGKMPKGSGIAAFWHGLMLPVWKLFAFKSASAIVSQSKDGEILSLLLGKWGYRTIRGSSTTGGKEAMQMITEQARQRIVLITPDGPQGPIYKFKPGAAVASFRAGTPLYLCRVKIGTSLTFSKSWDKFRLPLPFSRIIIEISEPLLIPKTASREEIDDFIANCESILNLPI